MLLLAATLIPAALATAAAADQGGAPNPNADFGQSHRPSCPPVPTGQAHCHAEVVTDAQGKPLATAGPTGYGPSDLASAYKLPTGNGAGQTVAIVDAYDNPNAEHDLGIYRSTYGLTACTTQNGCFKKVNQLGTSGPLPAANSGWAEEISLDLDVVSAVCPNCHVLLVETNSAYLTDLGAGVNTAAILGATAISNSYGGNEFSGESTYDSFYNHPGKPVTVSTGDSGYGAEYPATSPFVTAVGGTTLTRASNARGWSETAWKGAGSGCSTQETKPSFQAAVNTQCGRRAVADVAALANPSTGVSVYNTGDGGWVVFGGTSVAAPVIASVYALAGNGASINNASFPYTHTGSLFDVTSGTNGRCRKTPVLCTAGLGWDGPTGLGTPNGVGAF
jgi:subtilase family serine protease